jgi:uncharacterized protein involved in type VI secretion and phage assembly
MPTISISPIVSLAGENLSAAWLRALTEVVVQREYQVPARCTLRFVDPGYTLLAQNKVKLGVPVQVKAPGAGDPIVLVSAEVTSIVVEQREDAQPELVVVAMDKSHRMGRGTQIKSYQSMAYSDIVAKLAQSYGLRASYEPTDIKLDYVMQADSDLGLLTELARRVGFDWWVDDTTLNFKKPATGSTVPLSLYGGDLRSFSVRASGHHAGTVTVDGWNRAQQQLVTATATDANSVVLANSDLAKLVASPDGAYGSATLLSAGLAAQTQPEANQLSKAIRDRIGACAVTARGVTQGNGLIDLGSAVQVSDAGPLSGTYPVTRVEHVFRPDRGFITRFTSGDRRPTSLVDTLSGGARDGHGLLHGGLNVAEVTNIKDPDNKGRVKIRFPGVDTAEESGWARLVAVGGGTERGNVFIPEVGDEVLVAFEGGDLRQPAVIGGLYGSKSTIPTPAIEDGAVQVRGMTSRLGHVVLLSDGTSPDKQSIVLQLAGKEHTLHLGKDELDLQVPSGTPVNIVAGDTSIKFGKDGSISISGTKISIDATQELTLSGLKVGASAQTNLELEGQAGASLKGLTVQVNGDTAVTIKGMPVAIN